MKSISMLSLVLAFALTACDAGLGSSETVAAPTGSTPACSDGACPTSAVKAAPSDCSMCPSAAATCETAPECEPSPECDMDPAECQEKMENCGEKPCPKAGN